MKAGGSLFGSQEAREIDLSEKLVSSTRMARSRTHSISKAVLMLQRELKK